MDTSSLIVKFDPESAALAKSLAMRLRTTPEIVIVKALVLLKNVQGKKIILKEKNSPIIIENDLYAK